MFEPLRRVPSVGNGDEDGHHRGPRQIAGGWAWTHRLLATMTEMAAGRTEAEAGAGAGVPGAGVQVPRTEAGEADQAAADQAEVWVARVERAVSAA